MKSILIVLAGLLVTTLCADAASQQPNILVIMSDEHNPTVAGCYGNPIARTPNLDALAARGVVFNACYCNSPLCVPSRLSFTAGKYVSRVSAWNNNCKLPADSPSLPRVLNAVGYESFLCGKMHYDATCRYGFTEIGGNMNNSHMTGYGNRATAGSFRRDGKLSERFEEFRTGEQSSIIKHDIAVTAGAVKFLRDRKPGEKPFFLLAGYLAPHFPLIVPEKFWQHFKDKAPMPEIPPGYLDTLPLNYKHLRNGFAMESVPPDVVKRGRELYYGLTEWADNEIGQILAALRASPFADNTVAIYTSDHSENMGEHGLWWKNCVFDTGARIPLIVSWPARWKGGQHRKGACSSVDTVQTVAALAGAAAPGDWNGSSLVPWLDDAGFAWKDTAVSEYYAHHICSGYAMIRRGDWKYVYHNAPDAHHGSERELYNLATDPKELRNLAGDAGQQEHLRAMHAALLKEIGEDPEQTERRCRAETAKGYGEGKKGEQKKQRNVER